MTSKDIIMNMNEEVCETLTGLLNTDTLEYYTESIEDLEDIMVSDTVVREEADLFGGEGNILMLLNALHRIRKTFGALQNALETEQVLNFPASKHDDD